MTVVIVTGLPATGKTTVAKLLEKELQNCIRISSDEIRSQLFRHFYDSSYENEIYEEKNKQIVYNTINLLLDYLHDIYQYIIIDATYHKYNRRTDLVSKLNSIGSNFLFLITTAPEQDIQQRMEMRENDPGTSEARMEQYYQLKDEWDKFNEYPVQKIETTKPIIEVRQKAVEFVHQLNQTT